MKRAPWIALALAMLASPGPASANRHKQPIKPPAKKTAPAGKPLKAHGLTTSAPKQLGAKSGVKALRDIPRYGTAPSLFAVGQAEAKLGELQRFFDAVGNPDALAAWNLEADVGEDPRNPGEYFLQLRHKTSGVYRLVSVRDGEWGAVDVVHKQALGWTSKGQMIVVGESYGDSTSLGLTTGGLAGTVTSFPGRPERFEEAADGGFVIHGRTMAGQPISQAYSPAFARR